MQFKTPQKGKINNYNSSLRNGASSSIGKSPKNSSIKYSSYTTAKQTIGTRKRSIASEVGPARKTELSKVKMIPPNKPKNNLVRRKDSISA